MTTRPTAEQLTAKYQDAVRRMQGGEFRNAIALLEDVLGHARGNPSVLHTLAMCHMHLGQFDVASKHYRELIQSHPDQVDALINLGLCCQSLGQRDEAGRWTDKALELAPDHPRGLNLKGTLLAESGDFDRAGETFSAVLNADPANTEARLNLATAHYEAARHEEADQVLAPLLVEQPPQAVMLLGARVALARKRFDRTGKLILKLESDHGRSDEIERLALLLAEGTKQHQSVIERASNMLKRLPKDAELWNSRAQARFLSGQVDLAEADYRQAISLDANDARFVHNLGLLLASRGNREQAQESYRESIRLNPLFGEAYRSLAALKTFESPDDPDLALFKAAAANPAISKAARSKVEFSIGKALDDCTDYSGAFEHYEQGNRLVVADAEATANYHTDRFRKIAESLAREPANVARIPDPRARPVFVLGMPRSGTTLVEQILARHPDVTSCGELPNLEQAIQRLSSDVDYPEHFDQLGVPVLSQAAEGYLKEVSSSQQIETGLFTDKMPLNFRHVWVIRALFPDSPIIHCQRHPLDVVLSNYFQLFSNPAMDFVYDLASIARYYVGYHQLMAHWTSLFPDHLIHVAYERLVSDKTAEVPKLIEATGLPWDDRCLQQQASAASVRTASIWQVRREIYQSSVHRWTHYRSELGAAIQILQNAEIIDDNLLVRSN